MTNMPIMRAAFRTTVSGDGKYEMVFRFPSMEAMHTADDEWRAALSQPPEASEGEAVAWVPKGHLKRYLKGQNTGCWVYGSPTADDNDRLYAHPPKASPMQELQAMGQEFDANPAYQGCTCPCHGRFDMMHVVPCCFPPKVEASALRVALEWIVERDKTAASSAACEMANVARAALTKAGGEG